MGKIMKKMMAVGLTAALCVSAIGLPAAAEESTSSANFDWLSEGQPEGWTEADATETINYHTQVACYTLDNYATDGNDATYAMDMLIFDVLLQRDDTTGEYEPWLAESYDLAEDGSTMTFTIRQDAYFSNGEQVTADDCVFSFNRVKDDTEHLADSYAKPIREYVDSVEKIDDFSFVINFAEPNPEFTYFLCNFAIMCESAYNEMGYDDYWAAPIGSGPYVVEDYDSANAKCTLTLRDDEHGYWGYDYANSYTNVKTINITYSPESTTRSSSLQAGEADLIDTTSMDAASLEAAGFQIDVLPATTYVFLQVACGDDDVFSDEKLREALSLCIDRDSIVAALLDGYGYPAETDALPTDLGYQDEITYEYDPDRAAELVAESDYEGEELKFIYTGNVDNADELAQAIQSMAADVGLNLAVTPLEDAIYDESRAERDYDVCIGSIMKSGNMWYKTASEVIGTDRFNTGLTNTELMDLGQEVGRTMDQDELDTLLKEMSEIVLTEFEPNIYIYFPTLLKAQNPNLKDICWHAEHRADLKFAKVITE